MRKRSLLCFIAALALSACASNMAYGPVETPTGPSADITLLDISELPPPTGATESGSREYRIGPFDSLAIEVFGVENLERREYRVDAGGRLSFPLAGLINAEGLTLFQLEQEITRRLREQYIRDPQVTLNLSEAASHVITVDGAVKQPGMYPVVGRMTLMEAISSARGLAEFAKRDEVIIFRKVDGQQFAALYNLKAIRHAVLEDPDVYANDIVIVGDSPTQRLIRDAFNLAPALLSPLIITLAQSN